MIHIKNLHKTYDGRTALADVSLHVPRGQIFGLLGVNGAGKTTLISILSGILAKTSGQIVINGVDLDNDPSVLQQFLGLVPQHLAFYPTLSVQENLEFYAGMLDLSDRHKNERIAEAVAVTDLHDHLHYWAGRLSGGLQRRLNLAIGLLSAPQLLILDEPTVGIDLQSRNFILRSLMRLRDAGVTIIYTSHYLDEVQQICDAVAIIDRGRIIAEGSMQMVLQSAGSDLLSVELERPLNGAERQALEVAVGVPVQQEGGGHLSLTASLDNLERLITFMREQRHDVRNIRYGVQDLEQAFLRLTSTELQD